MNKPTSDKSEKLGTSLVMNEDCEFIKDLKNNPQMAMFNLITSKSAMKLWCKGIKPSRHWKISQVKQYFGMNGNKEVLKDKLHLLFDVITNKGSK